MYSPTHALPQTQQIGIITVPQAIPTLTLTHPGLYHATIHPQPTITVPIRPFTQAQKAVNTTLTATGINPTFPKLPLPLPLRLGGKIFLKR